MEWQTPKATNVSTPVIHHPERRGGGQPNLAAQLMSSSGGSRVRTLAMRGSGLVWVGGQVGLVAGEYARLIGEVRPRVAVMENVAGLFTLGIDAVLGTLAEQGMTRSGRLYGHRCWGAAQAGAGVHHRISQWYGRHRSGTCESGTGQHEGGESEDGQPPFVLPHASGGSGSAGAGVHRQAGVADPSERGQRRAAGARHSRGVTDTLTSAARVAGLRGPARRGSTSGSPPRVVQSKRASRGKREPERDEAGRGHCSWPSEGTDDGGSSCAVVLNPRWVGVPDGVPGGLPRWRPKCPPGVRERVVPQVAEIVARRVREILEGA